MGREPLQEISHIQKNLQSDLLLLKGKIQRLERGSFFRCSVEAILSALHLAAIDRFQVLKDLFSASHNLNPQPARCVPGIKPPQPDR